MGGRRPAGAGGVEVPESNTCLPTPDISLAAAVSDWVRRANGSITTNGLQLGRQLESAKEQFATQFTCRGIDENKCTQLLRNRQTSRRRSARIPFGIPLPRGEARARRHLRLRARIQPLPQMPILAPVNTYEEQVSQNTMIARSGRIDDLRTPQRCTACTAGQKVAFSFKEGTTRQSLLGTITENAPRRVTGRRRDSAIGSSFSGYPPTFFYWKEKNRVETTPNVSIRTASAPGRLIRIRERLGTNVAHWSVRAKLTRVRCAHREQHKRYPSADYAKWASGTLAAKERRAWHLGATCASDFRTTVRYAHWSAGVCIAASPGTPDRNKTESDGVRNRHRPTCAFDLRAPVRYAHRSVGECVTASSGTPDRNKTEPDDIRGRRRLSYASDFRASVRYAHRAAGESSQSRYTRLVSAATHNVRFSARSSSCVRTEELYAKRSTTFNPVPVSSAHRSAGERAIASPGTPGRNKPELGMEPPFPPLPGVCDPLFPGVVTFTLEEMGATAQLATLIARSFEMGMANTAEAASLPPLLLSSSPHSAIVMDSHMSVGTDGDAA